MLFFQGDRLPLDEIYAKDVFSAATHGERTLIVSVALSNKRPVVSLYLYDHGARRVLEIDDGRINLSIGSLIADAGETGFALLDLKTGQIVFLSQQGAFRDIAYLQSFAELPRAPKLIKAWPMGGGRAALTFRDLEAPDRVTLGVIHLHGQRFEVVHQTEAPENLSAHWLHHEGQWLWVVPETGEIALLDEAFQQIRVLAQPKEPVSILLNPSLREEILKRGVSPYGNVWEYPMRFAADQWAFRKNAYKPGTPIKTSETYILEWPTGQLQKAANPKFPIASQGNLLLTFDHDEGTFELTQK